MVRIATATSIACLALFAMPPTARSAPQAFQEAVVTEAVNRVDLLSGSAQRPAKVEDRIHGNDVIRTGERSRAELKFPDSTIARVGANAAFSFRPDTRGIDLQKGSILFHSPRGLGGGEIRTAAATASVLGTTIVVSATSNGGFKVLVLEGKAKVRDAKGRTLILQAGEMNCILPGRGGSMSPVITFHLAQQIGSSKLINGYKAALASIKKIEAATKRQEQFIQRGLLEPTGDLIGDVQEGDTLEILPDPELTRRQGLLDPLARRLFLALLHRYYYMLNQPAVVTDLPLDLRHVIHPGELDNPIAFHAFLLALAATGSGAGSPSAGDPGIDIISAPNFAFAPLEAGFIARGIAFNDATIHLDAFRPSDVFTFLSLADIVINGNLEVGGLRGTVDFHARGTIDFSAESTISSLNFGINMVFASGGPLSLNTVNFELPGGFLGLASGQSIDINSGQWFVTDGLRIAARGPVTISDLTLNGSYNVNAITEGPLSYTFPQVDIFAGGPITLLNTDFGNAEVFALTPDIFSIDGYFYARGLDAIAGTMDLDLYNLGYLDFLHLTQIDDWSLVDTSCYVNGDIALGSFGALSLSAISLNAPEGIALRGQDVFIDDYSSLNSPDTFGAEGVTIDAAGKLYVIGGSSIDSGNKIELLGMDVRLENASLTVDSADPLHAIRIDARDSLNLIASSLSSTGPILLNARQQMNLVGGALTAGTTAPYDLIRLTAGNRLNVFGTALNAANIRLQAITIALKDVNFAAGSQVTLRSGNGLLAPNPNSNQPVMFGFVNYIDNVRYGGSLLYGQHQNISIQKINP